jgi:hypothetical protein
MTRAGHSDCQGGLSPVQTQRGNDSCAQIPAVRRRLSERIKSTHSYRSSSVPRWAGMRPGPVVHCARRTKVALAGRAFTHRLIVLCWWLPEGRNGRDPQAALAPQNRTKDVACTSFGSMRPGFTNRNIPLWRDTKLISINGCFYHVDASCFWSILIISPSKVSSGRDRHGFHRSDFWFFARRRLGGH